MRILVVDDDRAARVHLDKMLKPLGEVSDTGSGQEALDAFANALAEGRPFNLVSMDIIMPGLDGQATLQAMRDLEKKHGVQPGKEAKVMMVTGLGDAGNVTRAFFKGQADGYVTKPLQQSAIYKTLRQMGFKIG
ncbi:MAG: response regulator [Humidesulfovibrio sp.]|uniref:response regulator n=1 Tax=Humidesulfovibrio sp. TaxID=2910988 RepID=UPI0027F1180D|nr:response regulator [Humidesulfovibrio sp.]MDQ7836152.1 response regulator [Humidesulfovibrio sp.]